MVELETNVYRKSERTSVLGFGLSDFHYGFVVQDI